MAGTKNGVLVGKNADFTQVAGPNSQSGEANGLITNGQLWIGSTALNAGGTHVNVGSLISPDSSVSIAYSSPNITLTTNGSMVGNTITGDSGGALSPTAGNWNILGGTTASGSSPLVTAGSGSTLTINAQRSQALAAADSTKVGLSNFDSASFAVDSNGFVTAIGGVFTPNATLRLVDDFIQNNIGYGQLQWRNSNVNDQVNGTAAHPGLLQVLNNTSAGIHLDENATNFPFVLGGGAISLNFVISLATLSVAGNRYTTYVGLMDDFPLAPSDGVYLSYSDNVNSGKWQLNCTAASVTTSVDTGIAAGTGYVNLGIQVNAAGTSVTATINGTTVGTPIASNIPSAAIGPTALWIRSTGALPTSLIDLFYLTNTLTTPR